MIKKRDNKTQQNLSILRMVQLTTRAHIQCPHKISSSDAAHSVPEHHRVFKPSPQRLISSCTKHAGAPSSLDRKSVV